MVTNGPAASGRRIAHFHLVKTGKWLQVILLATTVAATPAAPASKKAIDTRKKGTADRVKTERARTPAFDPAAVNDAGQTERIGPGSTGSGTLRAQILLDRFHFSPGEIDGSYGRNMQIAIRGFQSSYRLEPTGIIDDQTWQLLNADSSPALVTYTITGEDTRGPFERVPSDMMEQSKLNTLGYQSAAEELGEKFHINPSLLAKLNPGKTLNTAGEELHVPNVTRDGETVIADEVIVSKTRQIVEARSGGKLLAQYPATIGSEHDPLPIGEWKVTVVQRNPVFNYNPDLFWDADSSHSKAKIAAGPNNPVGLVWVGLSKEHYGIHGTPEPGTIGHTQSHGCIRLTNWDAVELAAMVKPGVKVILQEP
jgi:lipoprotein-anchoring transpeptidase ErfK/SrfK